MDGVHRRGVQTQTISRFALGHKIAEPSSDASAARQSPWAKQYSSPDMRSEGNGKLALAFVVPCAIPPEAYVALTALFIGTAHLAFPALVLFLFLITAAVFAARLLRTGVHEAVRGRLRSRRSGMGRGLP